MSCVHYKQDELYIEAVSLNQIAADYGTPCYVYSRAAIESAWHAFNHAFDDIPHRICYAVKANSNLAILQLLATLGSGFDIVSVGELERVLAAGGNPKKLFFLGSGNSMLKLNVPFMPGFSASMLSPKLNLIVYN